MKLVDRKDTRISDGSKHRFGEWRTGSGEWRSGRNGRQKKDRLAPALKGFVAQHHDLELQCTAAQRTCARSGNLVPILEATG
ncbi:hypothetical protein [Janthinobacterium sp.]|uniref:hypothetical protein n=1 Tax=Janthinobacterium sp. TaxID=1871054 RepID=UPI002589F82E|nr:hypothetical protein [Janthinobacterium sp.]MCX7294704.1 hypothetical protein [Janthinobacterium sp.]